LRALVGDGVDFRESYGATETGSIAFQMGSEEGMAPILGRTVWYSNVAMERLTFSEVQSAITDLADAIHCPISNFSYVASPEPPQYTFVIETDGTPHHQGDVSRPCWTRA
jgi:hypothetical protein